MSSLSTFMSFAKQRNVLLDDENIRFDICQAFAAEKSQNVLNFESFLFQDTEKPTSAPASYEIEGNKIRFCCQHVFWGLIFLFKNYSSSNMGADQKKDSKFQTFLDTHQYARKGILLYERIFGTTYVSTGGESTTAKFCSELSAHSLKVGYFFFLILFGWLFFENI